MLYLGLQEASRGGGMRGVLSELRAKFWSAWTSGLLFFSGTHLLMFLAPVWWVQPIIDNLSCLVLNTYLSILSNQYDGHRSQIPAAADDAS